MVTDDTSACDKPVLYGPPSHHRWSTQEVVVDDDDDDCNNSAADVYHDLGRALHSTQGAHVEDDGGGSTACVEVQHKILLWMTKLIFICNDFLNFGQTWLFLWGLTVLRYLIIQDLDG